MLYVKLAAVAVAFTFLAVACSQAPVSNTSAPANSQPSANKTETPAPAATIDEAAAARDLYSVHCMTCHRDSGKGGPVTVDGKKLDPDDLTSNTMKKKSDDKLKGYIADGVEDEGMPAFKDKLNAKEIDSLVKHIRALQSR